MIGQVCENFVPIDCFRSDDHVVGMGEKQLQAFPDESVVIGEQDAYGLGHGS